MTTQFLELYGAGLKNTADMMSAAFDGARQLQQQQLDLFAMQTRLAAHSSSGRSTSGAACGRAGRQPGELSLTRLA
jgi:hypothetical protein